MFFRKLVKAFIPKSLFRKIEPFGHLLEAVFFNIIYGFPAKNLKVIGVTGTNGKTTTCFLIHKMLDTAGYKVGLMTTVGYGAGDNIKPQVAHMTNMPVPTMLKRIKELNKQGIEWLVMETTSHALAQNRTWGLPYSLAVFTNLTEEHMDYHGSFANYRLAKLKLFRLVAKNQKGLRTGVINVDDPSSDYFEKAVPKALTYGIKKGEIRASDIKPGTSGNSFKVTSASHKELQIKTKLPGRFNIYNALAATGVGLALGLETEQIEQGISALQAVKGRMEPINAGQSFGVVIDYAHTPDALEKALKALREGTKGRVIVVFGAAGDRYKPNRPLTGEVTAKNADLLFLTDDEPYSEDPDNIRKAVYKGIESAGGGAKTRIIPDRKAAITAAFETAEKDDVVLLAGMGHQTIRVMNEGEIPWDEAQIAQELLGTN